MRWNALHMRACKGTREKVLSPFTSIPTERFQEIPPYDSCYSIFCKLFLLAGS